MLVTSVFCERRESGKCGATIEQTVFAAPKQDAHSGGEGNTEQLAGIDAILIIDADDASSSFWASAMASASPWSKLKSVCNVATSLLFFTRITLILDSSRAFWIISASRVLFAARLYWMLREEVHYAQLLQGSDAGQPESFCGRG
jgi:hypothetical protein